MRICNQQTDLQQACSGTLTFRIDSSIANWYMPAFSGAADDLKVSMT
jgi:hypothetical protein